MTKILILDTETTGLKDPEPVEIGFLEFSENLEFLEFQNLSKVKTFCQRYRPSKAIDVGASSIHGIYMRDVLHCPKPSTFQLPEHDYMIGHNIAFDHKVLGNPPTKLICTLKLARMVLPKKEVMNHKLTTLFNHFYKEESTALLSQSHGALADCHMTFLILCKLIKEVPYCKTWDDVYSIWC